ncbi:unnamed protein product [Candidula unifasciata]|uniref:Uncharacterized protein n=1 Tax=Candidula unifasciata TaxID=100452 RepID=A0A8S3ZT45_9EUPU|nr:unnamed protein product [Candidula unifasciata]
MEEEKAKESGGDVECDVCGKGHLTEECPELDLSSSKFIPQISKARLTVPLYLNPVEFPDGGVGIIALQPIFKKTQLGPFEAKKTMHDIERDDLFVLKILSKDGSFISLDASSEAHCNWMALVQVAKTEEEQNCMAYQLGINIFFNTTRDVAAGDELKVWYAPQYAKKLKKSLLPDGTTKSMLGEVLLPDADAVEEVHENDGMEGEESRDADESRDSDDIHPDDVEGDYTCKHCFEKFTSQFLFAKHIRDHLFPVYNYTEGPPRRGRRPVPLKIGDYKSYSMGLRGRPRGIGRGRGRPRGSHARMVRTGSGRGPGRPKRVFPESETEEEPGSKVAKIVADDGEEANNQAGMESFSEVAENGSGDTVETSNKEEEAEEINVVEKKRRGRPRKTKAEIPEDSSVVDTSEVSPNKFDTIETPLVYESFQRPRRSARAFRGLGKLGKWLKYPGEASSDEETPVGESEEDERVKPVRKRFGVAMAASLRKAAMDDITSPVPRKRAVASLKSPSRDFGDAAAVKNIKAENVELSSIENSSVLQETAKADDMISTVSVEDPQTEESPKKYIVVTKGDTTTAYEITESLEMGPSDSIASVLSEADIQSHISDPGRTTEMGTVDISEVVHEEVESAVRTDSGNNKENEVEVGTQEEVVGVAQHERKNTIADLDGTDALTALVNAAISADKVPDPIAMVAADLYEERSMDDDSDSDEYKASYRKVSSRGNGYVQTLEAGEVDESDPHSQPLRQRRKKRRRGDDPELEDLERRTKIVEGPNGTEEFACGICSKHFTQLKYLKLHLPAHTDRYRCNICGKRFARNESLMKHTCDDTATLVEQNVDEDGNDTFCCRECGRSFNQLNFAIRHASMHRARFNCEKCGRTFLRQDLLDEHDCVGGHLEEGEVQGEAIHECQICKQSFTSGKYLFRHMAMHTDIYKCEVCAKCYSRKDSLQRHISRCCPELSGEYNVHVCPNCKKTFGTQLGLQNHTLNCGKYQCGACKVAYFSLKDLAEHECAGKVLNEKASVQFPCKECNKTFASIAYLVRHEASHHGAFKCDLCNRVFIRKEELNWHTPVCTTHQKIQQEGSAPCETCGEVFNEWLAFKEHHMTHTHPHKCDRCGKRFIKIGSLHNHKCEAVGETGMDQSNLLSCDICQKTFKNERYLSRHLSLHGQPDLHFSCSSRSNMMKHMKVHGAKHAECPICHKKFHYENYLKLHVATVHEKQYQLQCTHCGKVLYSKTGLIAHIKQFHADTIKLYPCPKCGKTFRQKGNMKTHLISHTKDRAYKCDSCTKAFKYPDQLNRHRLEHTLSQKYSCELCDKQFVRTYELRNHMRNYHSGYVYVCGVCHECCAHRHTIIRHYKRKHPEVGNVFEEKPEFIDSLQKPVTAVSHSRLMFEPEDMKPGIVHMGLPTHEIIVTAEDGSHAYSSREMILHQTSSGELVSGDQNLHDVMEVSNGEQTLFILKVVNQDENGTMQEMELTDDTKAHLAQLLQAHGAGQDTITHIRLGDQTLQIQREDGSTIMGDDSEQMEMIQEIKFDPQQLAELQSHGESVVTKLDPDALGMSETVENIVQQSQAVVSAMKAVTSGRAAMEGLQVVEMDGGRLGHIIHMEDGGQVLEMSSGGAQVIQMESGQVIHLEQSHLDELEQGNGVVVSGDFGAHDIEGLSELKVTKRRGSNGEIVVEVEGHDGQMVDLSHIAEAQAGLSSVDLEISQQNHDDLEVEAEESIQEHCEEESQEILTEVNMTD